MRITYIINCYDLDDTAAILDDFDLTLESFEPSRGDKANRAVVRGDKADHHDFEWTYVKDVTKIG